uniref:Uncharacterized protein n=1 Tax=Anguilla anguilla TaxID=7936 RepID=A0A0E9PFM7_ANGAN
MVPSVFAVTLTWTLTQQDNWSLQRHQSPFLGTGF